MQAIAALGDRSTIGARRAFRARDGGNDWVKPLKGKATCAVLVTPHG
jgi:hypothetical protein